MRKPFSLQAVLDYKTSILELHELELAELLRERQRDVRRLVAMQDEAAKAREEMRCIQQAVKLDIVEIRWRQECQEALRNRIKTQRDLLIVIEEKIEAKREEVLVAHQEQEALNKLREQEEREQREEEKKRELHESDEIGTTRFFRQQKEMMNVRDREAR